MFLYYLNMFAMPLMFSLPQTHFPNNFRYTCVKWSPKLITFPLFFTLDIRTVKNNKVISEDIPRASHVLIKSDSYLSSNF